MSQIIVKNIHIAMAWLDVTPEEIEKAKKRKDGFIKRHKGNDLYLSSELKEYERKSL